ncbi:MAG: PEP-CTERM sorting domain-containing protein [Planctomycetota bacterium]
MRRGLKTNVAIVAVAVAQAAPVLAVEWTGATNDDWFNGANWDSGSVPNFTSVSINTTSRNTTRIAGATATPSAVTLAETGNGSLLINNGGKLSHFSLGTIGQTDGFTGTVTVDGLNAEWDITGGALYVGNDGNGILNVRNGGTVSSSSSAVVGRLGGSSGTVNVSGTGSTWSTGSSMSIGSGDNGWLNVTDGGSVVSTRFSAAVGSTGAGVASLDGPGSTWSHGGYMFVGQSNTGDLSITNGAAVDVAQYLYAGVNPNGGNGQIHIEGNGSRLDVGGDTAIGGSIFSGNFSFTDKQGRTTLADGGLMTVGGLFGVNPNADSSVRLDGGFLALMGDREVEAQALVDSGAIEVLADGGAPGWISAAGLNRVDVEYFADNASAQAFTGGLYGDLGGYTLITAAAVTGGLAGDYNASGQVEQGDLNLVLGNWGSARGAWPNADGFTTNIVDQEELNGVLSNWGSAIPPTFEGAAVPEPGALLGVMGGLAWMRRRR